MELILDISDKITVDGTDKVLYEFENDGLFPIKLSQIAISWDSNFQTYGKFKIQVAGKDMTTQNQSGYVSVLSSTSGLTIDMWDLDYILPRNATIKVYGYLTDTSSGNGSMQVMVIGRAIE